MRSTTITCKDCVDLLIDYVDQTLDPTAQKRLDEHLASCPPCIHFLKSYRKCAEFSGQMRDQKVQIPLELENRLKSFLKQELLNPAIQPPGKKSATTTRS
jgi:anti-sigma factor RsiW